ncbi:MAG: hypothetical protein RIC89_09845 [Pseudomonadales bacterium]
MQIRHLLTFIFFFPLIASADVTIGVWNIENLSSTVTRGFPELKGSNKLPPRTNATSEFNPQQPFVISNRISSAYLGDEYGERLIPKT